MNDELAEEHEREVLGLLLTNHQHIHENIKFADAKAIAFITIDSALVGFVYSVLASPSWQPISLETLRTAVGLVTCVILVFGVAFALWVIWPRLGYSTNLPEGVIDANLIRKYATVDKFVEACKTIQTKDLLDQARRFIYQRSKTDGEKYRHLRSAIKVSAVGWVVALILCLTFKVWPTPKNEKSPEPQVKTCKSEEVQTKAYSVVYSAEHATGRGREVHTFLLNGVTGDLWQMVCKSIGVVQFKAVEKLDNKGNAVSRH